MVITEWKRGVVIIGRKRDWRGNQKRGATSGNHRVEELCSTDHRNTQEEDGCADWIREEL